MFSAIVPQKFFRELVNVRTISAQVFGAAGTTTWTKPAGLLFCQVIAIGGGGSGAGVAASDGQAQPGAAGGGCGIKWFQATDLAASEQLTVGAGGVAVSGQAGNNGGDTTFANSKSYVVTAKGGGGTQFVGGAGSADTTGATGADLVLKGEDGT